MTAHDFKDQDVTPEDWADMFATPERFDDMEAFEGRVMRGLQLRMWLRQWLVVLAGFVGGVYALAQFVRMPDWKLDGKAVDADRTLRVGAEMVDVASRGLTDFAEHSGSYLSFMQTPLFFAVSFALCLAILGLYYAYSQEETL